MAGEARLPARLLGFKLISLEIEIFGQFAPGTGILSKLFLVQAW